MKNRKFFLTTKENLFFTVILMKSAAADSLTKIKMDFHCTYRQIFRIVLY